MTIIERARLCMATRPPAIETRGGNATTFSVASMLVWGFGLEPDEALPLMMEYNARCEPPWTVRELERMLTSVRHRSHREPRGYMVADKNAERGAVPEMDEPKKRRKPNFNLDRLKKAQAPGLPTDLAAWRGWLAKRCAQDLRAVTPEAFLDGLYTPGEKVLIFSKMWGTQGDYGRVIGQASYKLAQAPGLHPERVERLPGGSPEGMTWLMQPVNGKWYPVVKPRGQVEMSRRTKKSVTRWPFILLESDKAPHELWLNCMVRARIRIVAIIASGGRSLHALVRLDKETEDELLGEVKDADNEELLTLLGCDPQAMHGMVYPRLPNTMREGKRMTKLDSEGKRVMGPNNRPVMHFVPFRHGASKQALLYFNPAPERGRSISEGVIFDRE